MIAKKAGVKKLLIGHFSSKYDTLDEFETEAREVFANTELALEGVSYKYFIAIENNLFSEPPFTKFNFTNIHL